MIKRLVMPITISMALSGCLGDRTGIKDMPVITTMPPRAVVALSDVVNNIKCDMQEFLRNNDIVTGQAKTIGGTLTLTLDRSNEVGAGVKVGIPIATGIKIGGGTSVSNKASFGEIVTLPFVIHMGDTEAANCSNAQTLRVFTPDTATSQTFTLKSPILNLRALKTELTNIRQGEPKITFGAFQFAGAVAFTHATENSLDINILIINPSISDKVASDYKIEYKIGTNWKSIIKDAKFSMADPAPATIPKLDAANAPARGDPAAPNKPDPKKGEDEDDAVTHPRRPM